MPKLFEILDMSLFSTKCLNYFHKVVNKMVGMRRQDNIVSSRNKSLMFSKYDFVFNRDIYYNSQRRSDFLQLLLDVQQRDIKEGSPIERSNGVSEKDVFDIGSELNNGKKLPLSGKQGSCSSVPFFR